MDSAAAVKTVSEEELLRSRLYGLLAALLVAPPGRGLLDQLSALQPDDTDFGRALGDLATAARRTSPARAEDEYGALFIGISRGELVPYGSYYLTGFLHEKPLAALRDDMARLGIERAEGVAEPEDHAATLCEIMQGLIEGAFGAPAGLCEQKSFFAAHLNSWMPRFFADLEKAEAADFYRPVGRIGRLFLEIEAQAFAMTD